MHTYAHVCAHMNACVCICMHMRTYQHVHACMHACMSNTLTYKCIDVYTCAYIRMLMHNVCICMHTYPSMVLQGGGRTVVVSDLGLLE